MVLVRSSPYSPKIVMGPINTECPEIGLKSTIALQYYYSIQMMAPDRVNLF